MDTRMLPIEPGLSHLLPPGHRLRVECTDDAIEQLRLSTRDAELFPRERGTLWGVQDGDIVRVLGVSRTMMTVTKQPTVPVGWFQVRLEPEIRLNRSDLQYFDEHYPEPGTLAVILHPEKDGSARAAIFFREPNGRVQENSIHQEVVIPGSRDPARKVLAIAHAERPDRKAAAAPKPRGKWLGWSIAFVIGVLIGASALFALQLFVFRANPGQSATNSVAAPAVQAAQPPVLNADSQRARELTEQTRQLQSELEQEKTHARRLETLLSILRSQGRTRSAAKPVESQTGRLPQGSPQH